MRFKNSLALFLLFTVQGIVSGQNGDFAQRFEKLDKDGNGKLTEDELPRKQLFARLDQNKDGEVTLKEVQSTLGRLQRNQNAAFKSQKNLAYGQHKSQKLDLYLPKKQPDKKLPVMIYVHGGGWKIGNKSAVHEKPKYFVEQDWAFVSINYRLLPDGKHPKNVQDVAASIAWVHDNADKHRLDKNSIFIMGHSAGCHLVALVATDESHLKKFKKPLTVIKGVVALDTQAYDLPLLVKKSRSKTYASVFGTDEKTLRDASPIHHISANKKIPPFVVCFSRGMGNRKNEQRVKYNQSFYEALKKAGVKATLVDASDRNHGEINRWFGTGRDKKVTPTVKKLMESAFKSKNSE